MADANPPLPMPTKPIALQCAPVAIAAALFGFAMPAHASRFIASALLTPGVVVPCPVCMVRK